MDRPKAETDEGLMPMSQNSPTFADWAKLAARELKDTPVDALNRDYGDLPIKPAYFSAARRAPKAGH